MRLVLCLVVAMLPAATAFAQGGGVGPGTPSPQARGLIARWEEQNRRCVQQQGAAIPCARRQITSRKLKQLGWCYGRLDQIGLLYDWHRCRAGM